LNELAARANGEFLRLGASDDYLLPGGLDAQVRYLLSHPGKGAVIGDSVVVDQDGNKMARQWHVRSARRQQTSLSTPTTASAAP
jgi:hypothetical protein